ncbi:response regulator receiver domain [Brucella intermedia]
MTEGVSTADQEINLSSLVKEAFIDPIRSVLIIDDEYPTWEHVFGAGFNHSEEGRWKNKEDIIALIGQFRQKSKAMTIDIHDGEDNSDIGTYLHQSDLLVLDYQLEKGEGRRARHRDNEVPLQEPSFQPHRHAHCRGTSA